MRLVFGFLVIIAGSLLVLRTVWLMSFWSRMSPPAQVRAVVAIALAPGLVVVGNAMVFGIRRAFWWGIVLYPVAVLIGTALAWRSLGLPRWR